MVIANDVGLIDGELAISAITLAEPHFRVLVANNQEVRSEPLIVAQRKFDAPRLDDAVAASYDQLAAAIVGAGCQPRARSMDLQIAPTTHAYSARR